MGLFPPLATATSADAITSLCPRHVPLHHQLRYRGLNLSPLSQCWPVQRLQGRSSPPFLRRPRQSHPISTSPRTQGFSRGATSCPRQIITQSLPRAALVHSMPSARTALAAQMEACSAGNSTSTAVSGRCQTTLPRPPIPLPRAASSTNLTDQATRGPYPLPPSLTPDGGRASRLVGRRPRSECSFA